MHEGPKMWMDIQRGEGPNAPSLDSKPVYTGDVLTLVFTLQDNVFWFGANILSCTAVDGKSQLYVILFLISNHLKFFIFCRILKVLVIIKIKITLKSCVLMKFLNSFLGVGDNTKIVGVGKNTKIVDHYYEDTSTTLSLHVIENECSIKPSLFSHFFKKTVSENGKLINIYYAHFKVILLHFLNFLIFNEIYSN